MKNCYVCEEEELKRVILACKFNRVDCIIQHLTEYTIQFMACHAKQHKPASMCSHRERQCSHTLDHNPSISCQASVVLLLEPAALPSPIFHPNSNASVNS